MDELPAPGHVLMFQQFRNCMAEFGILIMDIITMWALLQVYKYTLTLLKTSSLARLDKLPPAPGDVLMY